MRILVKRAGALGDVLDVTPVTRRLKQENPQARIFVRTGCPQVFAGNKDVSFVFGPLARKVGSQFVPMPERDDVIAYDRTIDLDMAFENAHRKISPVEAYMEVAFGDRRGPFELFLDRGPQPANPSFPWDRTIVMHAGRSWPQRTLPIGFWTELAAILNQRKWIVLTVGTFQDWGVTDTIDTRNQFPLHQQAAMMHAARCFVGSESGPINIALTTDVPVVALLTMTPPALIERERHGKMGWRFHPLIAPIECAGCSARTVDKPVTYFDCPLGTNACANTFDPRTVAMAIEKAIYAADAETAAA